MAQGLYDIRAKQGCDVSVSVLYQTTDDDGSTIAVDLTGCTASMDVRRQRTSSSSPVISISSGSGITLGGESGTIDITIDGDDITPLEPGRYYYDLLLTFPSGTTVDFLEGEFHVVFACTQ